MASGDSSAVVGEMLDQINDAIIEAKSVSGGVPEITSVQVDLQLGTSSTANTGFPFGLILPAGQASEDHLHKVSLTFTPKPAAEGETGARPNPALVMAVEEIYRAVALANPHYQFQQGSMQIQCTLEAGLGVSSGDSSTRSPSATSSSSVQLVPIQFGASTSNQSIQTITLNFGPQGAGANALPNAAGSSLKSSGNQK